MYNVTDLEQAHLSQTVFSFIDNERSELCFVFVILAKSAFTLKSRIYRISPESNDKALSCSS